MQNSALSSHTSAPPVSSCPPFANNRPPELQQILDSLTTINYHSIASVPLGKDLTKKHEVVITVEQVLDAANKLGLNLCFNQNQPYLFNGAFWKSIDTNEVSSLLGDSAEVFGLDGYTARYHPFRASLYSQFCSSAYLPRPERVQDKVLINLLNGTFEITPAQQHLRAFDRRDFLTYQLPFGYDPKASCPLFQNYLDLVLPDSQQQDILSEFASYVFVSHKTLKLEKSLVLYGSGANGKSVFFEVLTALLGRVNVCNYSLQSLTNESGYQRAKLGGKLLNYASEISTRMDATIFKQLVSGEPVEARLPYGEPFILEDYAKLIFNTNELPKDIEQNDAFFRRFLILVFNMTIPEQKRDPQLAKRIVASELPGVFNWVLAGLKRLLSNRKFTESKVVEAVLQAYKLQADTVQLFLDEEQLEPGSHEKIALSTLYTSYREFSFGSASKNHSAKAFADALRKKGFTIDRRSFGKVVFYSKNIVKN